MPDLWEIEFGTNPLSNDAGKDLDFDGLSNLQEYEYNTNPKLPDSDFDSLPDGWEINYRIKTNNEITGHEEWTLNPRKNDTDNDGEFDGLEDFDQDGIETSPNHYDPFTNYEEYLNSTNPNLFDTDLDLMHDGWEVAFKLDPRQKDDSLDKDLDGLTNLKEYNLGLRPDKEDTDNDLLTDKDELDKYGTDPLIRDMDNDTMGDGFEVFVRGTNPNSPNNYFAILLNTGDPDDTYDPWPDSKNMDKLLRNRYGYTDKMIWKYEKGAATFSNFKKAIIQITALSDRNDTIYINLAAHGQVGYLQFSDGNHYYSEIDDWLDNITCDRMVISIDACYCGSAIPELDDGDNPAPRVIYAACKSDEQSDGTFHLKFTDGLGLSKLDYPMVDQNFGIRDGSGNGYVSVRESFLFAADYVHTYLDVDLDSNFDTALESNSSAFWEDTYLGEYRN